MPWRTLKYLVAFILPLTVWLSLRSEGWLTFVPLLYAFGLIPLIELFFRPDRHNLNQAEASAAQRDPYYDMLLYLMLPLQYALMLYFLYLSAGRSEFGWSFWGQLSAMGLMCGVIGINVGHELGHRRKPAARLVAKALLHSSLYTHFYIGHNYGHHRNVATAEDPASARYNEDLFSFWLRSISGSYLHAWAIQKQLLGAKKEGFWSRHNQMLWFTIFQLITLAAIYFWLGAVALFSFIGAAFIGILLLETVNYIEHYGLSRERVTERRYEKANPRHSWNSNHVVGRLVLFELSRHSDHHALPHKPYQMLDHHEESPQLPTGYPGMMLLAAVPPLWFKVMNPRVPGAGSSAQSAIAG